MSESFHILTDHAARLLAAKSSTFTGIANANKTISNVISEVSMHRSFCAQWGISEAELEATPESPATTAYGAYLLSVGLQGAWDACLVRDTVYCDHLIHRRHVPPDHGPGRVPTGVRRGRALAET